MIWKIKILSFARTAIYVQITIWGILVGILLVGLFFLQVVSFYNYVILLSVYVVSIIFHEFGHFFVALYYHYPVHSLNFSLIGGNIRLYPVDVPYAHQTRLAIAGSLVNLTLAFLVFLFCSIVVNKINLISLNLHQFNLLKDIFWINAGMGAINLLPIYPLDGSFLLEAWLRRKNVSVFRFEHIVRGIEIFFSVVFLMLGVCQKWWWIFFSVFILVNRFFRQARIQWPEEWFALPVSEFVVQDVQTILPERLLGDVVTEFQSPYSTILPVVQKDGRFVGIVTEHDLNHQVNHGNLWVPMEQLCQEDYPVLEASQSLGKVLSFLKKSHYRALPVVSQGKYVGMFYPGLIRKNL